MRTLGFLALIPLSAGVIGLTVGALWLVGSSSGQRERFSSLEIAPADPVFYMAINTEPSSSQWIAVKDTLETLNAKDPIRDAIDEVLLEFNLQFERDILPLAGAEGYFAITDIDALSTNAGGFVMAVQLRDGARAEEIFLGLPDPAEGQEEYEGETLYFDETPDLGSDFQDLRLAFIDDTTVIGASPADAKGVIDIIHGQAPSGEGNDRLQEMRDRQTDEFLVWGYFDMQRFLDWSEGYIDGGMTPEFGSSVDTDQLLKEARKYSDRLSFAVTAVGDGFTFDSTLLLPPDADRSALQKAFEPELASKVPADTLAFFSGFDPYNQGYAQARDQLESSTTPSGFDFQGIIDEIENEIGVNIEDDLLSLMTGEFGVAVNVSDFDAAPPDVEVLAAAGVSDPERVRDAVAKIGSYFEDQEMIAVTESDSSGVELWSEFGGSGEAVAWTVHDENLVFGYPAASVNAFVDGVDESLADSDDWKRTMDLLPGDKTFVGYMSLSRLIDELRKMEQVEAEFERSTEGKVTFDDLSAIQSLGMAVTRFDEGYGFHVALLVKD